MEAGVLEFKGVDLVARNCIRTKRLCIVVDYLNRSDQDILFAVNNIANL